MNTSKHISFPTLVPWSNSDYVKVKQTGSIICVSGFYSNASFIWKKSKRNQVNASRVSLDSTSSDIVRVTVSPPNASAKRMLDHCSVAWRCFLTAVFWMVSSSCVFKYIRWITGTHESSFPITRLSRCVFNCMQKLETDVGIFLACATQHRSIEFVNNSPQNGELLGAVLRHLLVS